MMRKVTFSWSNSYRFVVPNLTIFINFWLFLFGVRTSIVSISRPLVRIPFLLPALLRFPQVKESSHVGGTETRISLAAFGDGPGKLNCTISKLSPYCYLIKFIIAGYQINLKFFLFPEFLVAVLADAAAPPTFVPLPRLRRWASWS